MKTIKTVNTKMKNFKMAVALMGVMFLAAVILSSCSKDSDPVEPMQGQASVAVTDAAVDAENVTGVFLSVSEITASANGQVQTIATFNSPKLFNVMAYQNGDVYAMGNGNLNAGTYSDIRFIMSADADSYIELDDGTTKDLVIENATSTGYKVNGQFNVLANATTELVADIDLRKALVTTSNGVFKLRSTARLVEADATTKIQGTVSGNTEDRMVVYAYAKGTYNEAEKNAPADDGTRFENSINSAVVAENGAYTLAFMEEGEYEIIVASYSNTDNDSSLEFESELQSSIMFNGVVSDFLTVDASSSTSVTANIVIQ